MNIHGIEGYFNLLRERHALMLRRRAGQPPPWTDDPVLRRWRFCCTRREDDRVTAWFRERIRGPLSEDPSVWFAVIAFRWFNTERTGELLAPYLLGERAWDRVAIQSELSDRIRSGESVFTGAYFVCSRPGKARFVDVLDNLDWVRAEMPWAPAVRPPEQKRSTFEAIKSIPMLGNFSAYQVVADLEQTAILRDAADRDEFVMVGPGSTKGLGLCYHDSEDALSYGSARDRARALVMMRETLEASRETSRWPIEWPALSLTDVEHGFCEYAKWRNGHAGRTLRRRYDPRV